MRIREKRILFWLQLTSWVTVIGLIFIMTPISNAEETQSNKGSQEVQEMTPAVHKSMDFHYEIASPNSSWKILPKPNDILNRPASDVELYSEDKASYFLVIAEKAGLNLTTLKEISLATAKSGSTNFTLVTDQPVKVNGIEGSMLSYTLENSNMKFRYTAGYFVNKGFTYQLVGYTFASQYNADIEKDFKDIINSFKIIG